MACVLAAFALPLHSYIAYYLFADLAANELCVQPHVLGAANMHGSASGTDEVL